MWNVWSAARDADTSTPLAENHRFSARIAGVFTSVFAASTPKFWSFQPNSKLLSPQYMKPPKKIDNYFQEGSIDFQVSNCSYIIYYTQYITICCFISQFWWFKSHVDHYCLSPILTLIILEDFNIRISTHFFQVNFPHDFHFACRTRWRL